MLNKKLRRTPPAPGGHPKGGAPSDVSAKTSQRARLRTQQVLNQRVLPSSPSTASNPGEISSGGGVLPGLPPENRCHHEKLAWHSGKRGHGRGLGRGGGTGPGHAVTGETERPRK